LKKVISHDLMLARGWPLRGVALLYYAITFALVVAAWRGVCGDAIRFGVLSAMILGVVLGWAIRLGVVRGMPAQPGPARAGRIEETDVQNCA
jgi:hypothetical protein